jgi:hypothetical protein
MAYFVASFAPTMDVVSRSSAAQCGATSMPLRAEGEWAGLQRWRRVLGCACCALCRPCRPLTYPLFPPIRPLVQANALLPIYA